MFFKITLFISISFIGILLTPDPAFAWGAGMHITQGTYILKNLNLIAPEIATILKAFPYDYLYGCISADIFIGKGVKKSLDHCHNWSVGRKMLSKAKSKENIAFVYGYLSHLAADIISHNIYVPNQLYMTSSTKRFGHIYWESRSDELLNKKIWKTAKDVIDRHNSHNDAFLQEMIKRKLIPFKMKKRVFSHSVKMNELSLWQKAAALVSKNSRWDVKKTYINELNRHSINLIIDFLKNGEKSLCFKFDPVGSDKLLSAKKKRKEAKAAGIKGNPRKALFKVPANIRKLSYVKTKNLL